MECVRLSPQLCFNPQNVVSSDDFFVDQLLDLSDHDEFLQDQTPDDDDDDDKPSVSLSNLVSAQEIHQDSIVSDFPSLPTSELTVPVLIFIYLFMVFVSFLLFFRRVGDVGFCSFFISLMEFVINFTGG